MNNAKELGFLFGYLEKSAVKGLRLRAPKRAPVAAKPKPSPKTALPAGAVPLKQVRGLRLRAEPRPEVTAKAISARGAQPVGPTPAASPAPVTGANSDAYGDMARALGQNVGAATSFVPWNERLSPKLGIRPKTLDAAGSIAGGLVGSQLLSGMLQNPQEEALRSYLVANPFMYDQLNPYAASMMA
jgi:hypothetical protein